MAFPFAPLCCSAYIGPNLFVKTMNPTIDPLNIVLLIAAVVIFWRLRSVLGTRTGLERPPTDYVLKRQEQQTAPSSEPIDITPAEGAKPNWSGIASEGSELAKSLDAIVAKYTAFDPKGFMKGAAVAYEMILEAFAAGNKGALKDLLASDVFKAFSSIIDERAGKGETHSFQLVTVKKSILEQANLIGSKASMGVRFAADVISARKDKNGNLLEGDEKAIREISDFWVFERDMTSRNPNWKLVSTGENG
jgi:predicted lipid-binding transport protein (Tim44 family)